MHPETEHEIRVTVERLAMVAKDLPKQARRVLYQGARVVLEEIKSRTPYSSKPHSRYSTPKLTRKLRAPKGFGKIAATYNPGNLEDSMDVLRFSRSEALFVGPRMGRRSKGNDGYYAGWVEKGTQYARATPFIHRGAAVAEPEAVAVMEAGIARIVKKYNLIVP